MSEILKMCPFCGAQPHQGASHGLDGTMEVWIECSATCGGSVLKSTFLDRTRYSPAEMTERGMQLAFSAREAWNSRIDMTKVLEEIDRLAEAGLCQMSLGGKHSFLSDIRRKVAEQGIQGGLTEYGS